MRVLLMHHGPLAGSPQGALVRGWAEALVASGHEARLLVVDDHRAPSGPLAIRAIVCCAGNATADLPFGIPSFAAESRSVGHVAFGSLTDEQLRAYREQLRRYLDAEVDQFDPHVVHAQHVWIGAQLALETGVPYVASAWSVELAEIEHEPRYRRWVEQAAENAARILVSDASLLDPLATTFELPPEQLLVMTAEMLSCDRAEPASAHQTAARQLVDIYQCVLDERFGRTA